MTNLEASPLEWSSQFGVAPQTASTTLPGDKILLPPSALEKLLSVAPRVTTDGPYLPISASTFDPYDPQSFAAERYARAQTRYETQQLPHPLTFRLVNPINGRVCYCGIQEFSAEEGTIVLSDFLAHALSVAPTTVKEEEAHGINRTHEQPQSADGSRITVHAKQLSKGTYVKLRPLEAGYDPEDWKSLLEEYMRKNFTTLSQGEILAIPAGRSTLGKPEEFQFLIDGFKPDGDGICVVDTDLEVDIEALNEEQARETLRIIAAKAHRAPGTKEASSPGGQISLFKSQDGQVLDGEYVDYQLPSWDREQGISIELDPASNEDNLELFVSPFGTRQREKPRDNEHVFDGYESRPAKRIRISSTNVELEEAEELWISIHAPATLSTTIPSTKRYSIRALPCDLSKHDSGRLTTEKQTPNSGEVECKNCQQIVPERSLMLHENFCFRNNILCPHGCGQVFEKRHEAFQNHWHCPHDLAYGNTTSTHSYHDTVFHKAHSCPEPSCNYTAPTLPILAHHRTSACPGKQILCTFCHLILRQEGDPDGAINPEALLSNLTPHELSCGARTTNCHICNKIVRLRDMSIHLKHHDLERHSRPAPRVCRNNNCGRTLDGTSKSGDTRAGSRMGQGAGNDIGLCSACFGPLYVSMYDPEGKALRRRIERRYLQQLLTGCGKSWCRNEYCRFGRKNIGIDVSGESVSAKEAVPMVKPFVDGLAGGAMKLHFCVDEGAQKRRVLAELVAAEGRYGFEWCIAALEAEGGNLERAREWLKSFAPLSAEEKRK